MATSSTPESGKARVEPVAAIGMDMEGCSDTCGSPGLVRDVSLAFSECSNAPTASTRTPTMDLGPVPLHRGSRHSTLGSDFELLAPEDRDPSEAVPQPLLLPGLGRSRGGAFGLSLDASPTSPCPSPGREGRVAAVPGNQGYRRLPGLGAGAQLAALLQLPLQNLAQARSRSPSLDSGERAPRHADRFADARMLEEEAVRFTIVTHRLGRMAVGGRFGVPSDLASASTSPASSVPSSPRSVGSF